MAPKLPDPNDPHWEDKMVRLVARAERQANPTETVLDEEDIATPAELEYALTGARLAIAERQLEKLDLELEEMRYDARDRKSSHEKNRVYFFTGQISERDYEWMVKTLAQWARDSKEPITVVVNSPGGYVIHTLAMYDFLRGLSHQGVPIKTVGIGEMASGGGILLQAGDERILTPNSWFLVHEVSAGAIGKSSELADKMKFIKRLQEKCINILAKRSTLTAKEIATKWKKLDWWMDAEESVRLGFADRIEEGWSF